MIKKILLHRGREYAWRKGDFHTNEGMIKEAALKGKASKARTNTGKEFLVFEPNFNDLVKFMKRGPQMPLAKDVAIILYYSGIGRKSVVVDAGTGSGLLAVSMARIAKTVTSYEIKTDVHELAKANVDYFGLKNLILKNKDVTGGIDERDVDLVTLDLPEPWHVLKHAWAALKIGGILVTYLPSVVQLIELVSEAKKNKFSVLKTVEILEREWIVDDKIVRPSHEMYGHTAFLTFLRKL